MTLLSTCAKWCCARYTAGMNDTLLLLSEKVLEMHVGWLLLLVGLPFVGTNTVLFVVDEVFENLLNGLVLAGQIKTFTDDEGGDIIDPKMCDLPEVF